MKTMQIHIQTLNNTKDSIRRKPPGI